MQGKQQGLSQIEKLSEELEALAPNISSKDKIEFVNNSIYRKSTISAYLNGHGLNIDTAMEMLLFFRKRIAEREKVINAEMV